MYIMPILLLGDLSTLCIVCGGSLITSYWFTLLFYWIKLWFIGNSNA